MSQCPRCFADLATFPPNASAGGGQICASCGAALEQGTQTGFEGASITGGFESASGWFKDFFSKVREITFKPKSFFERNGAAIAGEEGISSALAFAVLVQWIAAFFNFIWRALTGAYLQERFSGFFRTSSNIDGIDEIRQKATEFLFGAGTVVLTPFITVVQILFAGFLIHIAVRLFIREPAGRPLRYATTVRILALANAPWILCFIPGLGVFLAWILSLTAAIAGIREVYKTTNFRSTVSVLFPELLFLAFVLVVIFAVLFFALGTLRLLL